MSPETQKALEAFVMQIIEAAKSGAAWTSEQTPLLVQEWLQWQLTSALMTLIIWGSFLLIFWLFAFQFIPNWCYAVEFNGRVDRSDQVERAKSSKVTARVIGCVVAGVVSIPTLIGGIIPSLMLTLKVLVAPRVVVFEKFLEVLK